MSALPYAARRLAEITQRSPIPELGGELSRCERQSVHEAEYAEEESRRSALAIHEKAVIRALDARARLQVAIDAGIPTKPIKGDPDAAERARIAQAVDAFARSQCWLREAAQAVCDICEFDDNGKAAGVVWETPLAGGRFVMIDDIVIWGGEEAAKVPEADRERVKAEYVGAAIADSMFCQSCGARGFVECCPRCARCD